MPFSDNHTVTDV